MTITWDGSSFTIPERDFPNQPISSQDIDGGDHLRSDAGSLYNPVKYSFDGFTFSFLNITNSTLQLFKNEIYVCEDGYEISDSLWGTVNVISVPNSFSYSYLTKNNHSMTFQVEERGF